MNELDYDNGEFVLRFVFFDSVLEPCVHHSVTKLTEYKVSLVLLTLGTSFLPSRDF